MKGLRELAGAYDGFIVDLWGVVHDGIKPFAPALEALEKISAAGKPAVFLSNAPRRAQSVGRALAAMGVGPAFYSGIVTSGEAVHVGLRDRLEDFHGLGPKLYHLGPARDRDIFDTLADYVEVEAPEQADFLLNSGPDDLLGPSDPALYDDVLEACLARGLPMVCANPDLEVVRDGKRIICAGLLAQRYAAAGGRVIARGKPDKAIYGPVLELLGVPKARVLAIGDSLRTDIAGAKAAGIDALWVLSGIHALEPAQAQARAEAEGFCPAAVLPGLAW